MRANDLNRDDLRAATACIESAMRDLGAELLILRQNGLRVSKKPDNSIVTNADLHADRAIQDLLANLTPHIPVVSEESFDSGQKFAEHQVYWCADPVDSTQNYADGGQDFSILVSLIESNRPILGLMYFPAQQLFFAGIDGVGAWKKSGGAPQTEIHCAALTESDVRVVVSSRGHAKPERLSHIIGTRKIASVNRIDGAIKFARIADGQADLYPRFTNLREWDLAAGHAIVMAAGGSVMDISGKPIIYGARADYICPHFFATGKKI